MMFNWRILKTAAAGCWTRKGRGCITSEHARRHRSLLSGTASQPRDLLGTETTSSASVAADFSLLPSPRGLPVVGTTLALLKAGSTPQLHRYVDARHTELGPVYRESIGPVDVVFVSDPVEMRRVFQKEGRCPMHVLPDAWMLYNELYGCKRGLFFMNGDEWLKHRRIMNRILLKQDSVDVLMSSFSIVASTLIARWTEKQPNGDIDIPNLEDQLYRCSIDIIVALLLGKEAYQLHSPELNSSTLLSNLTIDTKRIFEETARLSLLSARMARTLHLPAWSRFERAVDRAMQEASSLVLELLPMARGGDGMLEALLHEGMELKDIVRIVADLILAAADTTSYATQWALYLLARNPEQQELVFRDVQQEENSPLVRGVIREALRLYPVAPFITRILPEDCELAGFNIPAGTLIALSMYTSGRSANNFPSPERFWPERWLRNGPEEAESGNSSYRGVTNPYASLPFAFGVRSCIGRKVAESQMLEIITQLVRDFRMELKNPQCDIQMILKLVSVPSEPIQLRLVPR